MISEHKVTLVLSIGLKPYVCNKRGAAVRRPPTARRESPTARDTWHRENFRNNFKYEVPFKILLNKSVIFKMVCHLMSFFKERVYIYICISITESLCCTKGINNI